MPTLMGYFNDLPAENWISYLKAKKPIISFKTQKEREALQASLLVELPFLIGRNEISSALDRIDFGLYLDKDYFFERMKKQRVLRHSNYLEKLNPVGEIAGHLLDNQDFFKWSTKDKNFLSSLIEFKVFFEELSAINEFINEEIEDFRVPKKVVIDNGAFEASRIKCLLAKNDYYFLTDKQASRSCEKLTMLEFYTKEEISEAISLLVSKYNKKIGFRNSDLNLIDADYANSEICNKLIIESCRYKAIVELELEIEIYGYICTNQNGSQVIDHPDQNFSIAIELANIQYELQAASNAYGIYLNNQDALSVVDAANFYHKQFPDYFELKTYPFPRYTLAIRTDALEFLTGDEMEFFREELNILENIGRELLISPDALLKYELRPGFVFYDFLRLYRYFVFQYHLLASKMIKLIGNANEKILLQSVIGISKKGDLVSGLSEFSTVEKVNTFLDMISWKTKEEDRFLDLQYTPVIEHDGWYIMSNTLLGLSKLYRNIFFAEQRVGNAIKSRETKLHTSMPEILSKCFEKKGFETFSEVAIKYSGSEQLQGDIDFIAFKDDILFIAECKDSLHPTDLFEMRTTFDYMKKAVKQLKFIREALDDIEFLKLLCKRLQISFVNIKKIEVAIVMSNNKLWGYSMDGIPIRNFRELTGFLNEGKWSFSLYEDNLTEFRLWETDDFQVSDLSKFLSLDGPHQAMYQSCIEKKYIYGKNLYKTVYALRLDLLQENLKKKYKFELTPLSSNVDDIDK